MNSELYFRVIRKLKNPFRRIFRLMYNVTALLRKRTVDIEYKYALMQLQKISPKPSGSMIWELPNVELKYDLSIIIPFYNTEKFAKRCIESVLSQVTDFSYEVILVDDGSPDSCGTILDSYANRENVVVIHQANAGLSSARNTGIKAAKGRYFLFADSDDVICPNIIDKLLMYCKTYNADIVEGSYYTFKDNGEKREFVHAFKVGQHGQGMYGFAWGKILNRKLFTRVCFPEGYWYEDTIMGYLIHPLSGISVTAPDLAVGYYMNSLGITSLGKGSKKSIETVLIVEEALAARKYLKIENDNSVLRASLYQLSSYAVHRTLSLNDSERKALFVVCSNIAEEYGILSLQTDNFYEKEIIEAIKNKQYKRWKWASLLI